MKKYFLSIVLFLGVAITALQAQNIAFGVRAGVSLANIRGQDASDAAVSQYLDAAAGVTVPSLLDGINLNSITQTDPKSLTSFFAGAYLDIPLVGSLHLEPGVYLAS